MTSLVLKLTLDDGPTIRGLITNSGEERYAVVDFMAKACQRSMATAAKQFHRMINDDSECKEEILALCQKLTFPGCRGQSTYTMTLAGLQRLLLLLGGKVAAEFRKIVEETFRRVMGGDRSLIQVIEANAASNAPMQQAYRASLAAEPPSSAVDDVCIKRKRDELEHMKTEMEMKFATIKQYQNLCVDTTIDERAKILFKDSLLNSTLIGGRITNGASEDATPISLSQMGVKLGYHLSTDDYKKVGKIMGKLYREAYDAPPTKHTQLVNGQAMEVNTYFAKDKELVKKALEQYARESSAPDGPGIEKFFSKA
jgi:hypothetical protein